MRAWEVWVLGATAAFIFFGLLRFAYLWGKGDGLRLANDMTEAAWARRYDWRPGDVAAITRKQCSKCWADASACVCAKKGA